MFCGPLSLIRRDGRILFVARMFRMFAFGLCGVILAVFLHDLGLSDRHIGSLLSLTLLGDAAISLLLTSETDKWGRRFVLAALGAPLMIAAGLVFALIDKPIFWLLLLAATAGVISPFGNEVGPFMAVEQSVLSQILHETPSSRTLVFAWYSVAGYFATAAGSAVSGSLGQFLPKYLPERFPDALSAYHFVFALYALVGLILTLLFSCLSRDVEAEPVPLAPMKSSSTEPPGEARDTLTTPLLSAENRTVFSDPALGHDSDTEHNIDRRISMPVASPSIYGTPALRSPASTSYSTAHGSESGFSLDPSTAVRSRAAIISPIPSLSPTGLRHMTRSKLGRMRCFERTMLFGVPSEQWGLVSHLSLLFALDAFGGGLTNGSLLAYFLKNKFGSSDSNLGGILAGANVISGLSSLVAAKIAEKFGLINTMVFTHLPSNVLLILIGAAPTFSIATAVIFLRYSISQMDVGPRQSYIAGVVPPECRTAVIGVTNVVRSLGAAAGPFVTGFLASHGRYAEAFYLAGSVKIVYDLLLLWSFSHVHADVDRERLRNQSQAQSTASIASMQGAGGNAAAAPGPAGNRV